MRTKQQREPPELCSDDGSVSIEAALALSSLVIVCGLIIAAMATLAAYLAAVDAAGAAARAQAIGESFEPARGHVDMHEAGGMLTATATIPAPIGQVSASAVFPVEN